MKIIDNFYSTKYSNYPNVIHSIQYKLDQYKKVCELVFETFPESQLVPFHTYLEKMVLTFSKEPASPIKTDCYSLSSYEEDGVTSMYLLSWEMIGDYKIHRKTITIGEHNVSFDNEKGYCRLDREIGGLFEDKCKLIFETVKRNIYREVVNFDQSFEIKPPNPNYKAKFAQQINEFIEEFNNYRLFL